MSYVLERLSSGSGLKEQGTAGANLSQYKLVYMNSAGVYLYANASSEDTMPAIAITLESIPQGRQGSLLFFGLINNNNWDFTPGQLLYMDAVEGNISSTPPSQPGHQIQIIGKALQQTLIIFNPSYMLVGVGDA